MSRSQKSLAGFVVLVVLALMWSGCGAPKPPETLRIATGTEGGTYFVVGRRLARLLEEYSRVEIGKVEATKSLGTLENCRRLADSKADLALAIGPVLAITEDPCTEHIAAVMALYVDRVQIVARNGIEDVRDLKGKDTRLYIGADQSGTKVIAEKILAVLGISNTAYTRAPNDVISYKDASDALQSGRIEAAFFISATPTKAVSDALGSSDCCHLLDLGVHVKSIEEGVPGLKKVEIPANSYPRQANSKVTVGASEPLDSRTSARSTEVSSALAMGVMGPPSSTSAMAGFSQPTTSASASSSSMASDSIRSRDPTFRSRTRTAARPI